MARADGDIVITVGGDVSPLTDAVAKAERTLGRLNTATHQADRQFRAMAGTTSEVQDRINALSGFTDRLGKSAEKSAKAFEGFDRSRQQIDRLRASYDPLFAASKQYEAAVEQLDEAMRLGVISQGQYAQMTARLGQSMLTAGGQAQRMGGFSRDLGYQVQNASYQVGDFFVQIASGTDATRALAQQMPQLLGSFGMWGALAGAGVAIGGALIPMFMSSRDSAKDLDQALESLKGAQDRLNASVALARAPLSELIEKYGAGAARFREMAVAKMQLDVAAAKSTFADSVANIADAVERYTSVSAVFHSHTAKALEAVEKDFGLTGDAAWDLIKRLKELGAVTDRGLQMQQFKDLVSWLEAAGIELEEMPPALAQAASAMLDVNIKAEELGALIDVAVGATFDWSGAMSSVKAEIHGIAAALSSIGGGMIDNAAKFVELNARKAGKSKAEAVRARKEYEIELQAGAESMGGSWYDRWLAGVKKQVALKGLDIDDQLAALDAAESASKRGGRKKSRSGSSDREGEQAARNLERIQRDFLTEQELLAVQYQEKLDGLAAARDRELLTEQEYQALKLQAQADFNAKSASLDRQALQEKLAAWSGGLGDLAGLMNTGNRKLFKIGKMAAIAQAVVDGWSAATSAWDKGMKIGGPPVAAAFSAMSIARTGAMIASIKSTQFDGGGGAGGGGSAGSGSGAAAAAQQPLQVRMLGLSPDSIISGADLGTLLNRLNDEAGDRGYNLLTRG